MATRILKIKVGLANGVRTFCDVKYLKDGQVGHYVKRIDGKMPIEQLVPDLIDRIEAGPGTTPSKGQ